MPITFLVKPEQGYYISKYAGRLTDDDLIKPWMDFYENGDWVPCMNELADIRELDGEEITFEGIMRLAEHAAAILKENCKYAVKAAVYSPNDLPFGLARML